MPVWFIEAGLKAAVDLWQVSHGWVVEMWPLDLPKAWTPLWQDAQPLLMPLWSIAAVLNVVVDLWQVSHAAVVEIWELGLPRA
jgi:hypothetical protein